MIVPSVNVIKKCCAEGHSYNQSRTCSFTNSSFIYDLCEDRPNCSVKISPMDCSPYRKFRLTEEDEWTLTPDGLTVQDYATPRTVYCLEQFDSSGTIYPFLCLKPPTSIASINDTPFVTYGVTYLISFVLIVLTFIIYSFVFKNRPIHSRSCNINYFAALSLATGSMSVVQLLSTYFPNNICIVFEKMGGSGYSQECLNVATRFAVQFFFLATFFWLNIMCIDIYWVFSGFKLLRGSASERDRKKLLFYSLYAWGVPLLISTMTVGVDYSGVLPDNSIYKPNVGTVKCFLVGRTAQWVYLYGPMGVIIICNSVLYTITAIRLFRHRRETAVLKRGDSRKHDGNEKERFNLYLKLFVVMGINWLAELASFIFGENTPKEMWYVTDVANTLQGLFIFLIFVCKQRVRRLVWKKLCKSRSQSNGGPRESIQTTQTSSSSNNSNSMKLKQVFFSCCFDSKADKEENKPTQKPCEIPTLSVDISGKYSDLKQTSLS